MCSVPRPPPPPAAICASGEFSLRVRTVKQVAGLGLGVLRDLTQSRIFKSLGGENQDFQERSNPPGDRSWGRMGGLLSQWIKWAEQRGEAGHHTSFPSPLPWPAISTQGFITAASTRNEHFYGNGGTFSLCLHW